MNTYISLFSSAGVGCYGFKMENFECIATNEIIERRLDVQKHNKKCKYSSGYICGDITKEDTKKKLYSEVDLWKEKERIKCVDVIIATPPCQGMSVANHKKNKNEIVRNSLVVESIKIIKEIRPNFFIFENVPSFMKTICTDADGKDKTILEAIDTNLGKDYSYVHKIINFKNYGACSSRTRTIVIGVNNRFADEISPYELYPKIKPEKTLRETIGSLKRLNKFGEIDRDDIYHAFRKYPEYMREWIKDLGEGQSAFDNADDEKKPHQIKNGKIVVNKNKNGDKYRRQIWDKVGPCVHTRNDQLASQNTIHPEDDRVFSIRELMKMMTVPETFRWSDKSLDELNSLTENEKKDFLRNNEMKIRQSLGEAVPTIIFQEIASNICSVLNNSSVNRGAINSIIKNYNIKNANDIIRFINDNPLKLSLSTLSRIAEIANTSRTDNAAYYTNKSLITEMLKSLPDFDKNELRILEPSAGVGNFIPLLIRRFEDKKITIDLVDTDANSLKIAKLLFEKIDIPKNVNINYIVGDFLTYDFEHYYDLVIGNPPFYKINNKDKKLEIYKKEAINKDTTNICSFFLDKATKLSDYVSIIFPKFLLNTPEFAKSRGYLSKKRIDRIIDFGEKGFAGVLIETIAIFIDNNKKPGKTVVKSITHNITKIQNQSYIFDDRLPYWIIYRDDFFDNIYKKMTFDCFDVFRDRQITNKLLKPNGEIRVLKSRNINDDGTKIINIDGYDSYISNNDAFKLSVYSFINSQNVYITPNMTYKPRVMKKPAGTLVNGSVAILIPKGNTVLSKEQLLYFSTEEYRQFYKIARNYQTRSLNVDSNSVFFYGLLNK